MIIERGPVYASGVTSLMSVGALPSKSPLLSAGVLAAAGYGFSLITKAKKSDRKYYVLIGLGLGLAVGS